jgi:SRSO17 transposase
MQAKQLRAWRSEFEHVNERIADCFVRREPRDRARAYLQGLLEPLERKNGWHLAEAAGDRSPDGMQDFLARSAWDADTVRDQLRDYVVEHLGEPDGVLVLDETGFVKKGEHSAGVKRQYSGTAGRIENCQVGVFMAYASRRGYAFIDRELYLPKEWTQDTKRRQVAHVPEAVMFRTKPEMGAGMIERALKARVPFAWVTADSVYGDASGLRRTLVAARRGYVLAVLSSQLWSWPRQTVATYANKLPAKAWRSMSCGAGAKGPRFYQWAYIPGQPEDGFIKGVLVRRHRRRHWERAYYLTYAPVSTPLEKLVEIAGSRWTIESGFEQAKGEVGLDQYEVRRYDAWYRHITLALLAHAYLAVVRAQGAGKKHRPGTVASALAPHRAGDPAAAGGLGAGETDPAGRHQGMVKVAAPPSAARQAMPLGRSHPPPT